MSIEKSMADKVTLVTGGTSGIGEATALLYAQAGAKVVLTGRNVERGNSVVAAIKAAGGEATFFQGDVTSEDTVKNMVQFVVDTYGRIDCAFNNAGISGPIKRLTDVEFSEWQFIQSTNLTSIWLCLKYEIIQMMKQGGGVIVNHASLAGLQAMPLVSSYVAAKHGIVGLTKSVALEYTHDGIRANAICPGSIDTPLIRATLPEGIDEKIPCATIPMQRFGKAREVAELVLWLSSDKSSYITGQAYAVDGGESAGRYVPLQEYAHE